MGVNSLPVTRQRRCCDLNPGPSALECSMLTTRPLIHPSSLYNDKFHCMHTDWKGPGRTPIRQSADFLETRVGGKVWLGPT